MSIEVTSTTDTQEDITAATGDKSQEVKVQEENVEQESAQESTENQEQGEENEENASEENEETEANEEGESQDENDSEDDDNEETSLDAKDKRRKSGYQRAKFQRDRAREEAEYWKSLALKQQKDPIDQKEETPDQAPANDSSEPREDDFDEYSDYLKALAKWEIKQELKSFKDQNQKQQFKKEAESKANEFTEKMNVYADEVPDYWETLQEADETMGNIMSPGLKQAIEDSDHGEKVLYEIAKDLDLYQKLVTLTPLKAAIEVGKIESKILAKTSKTSSQKNKVTKTKAPKPISPIGSSKTGSSKKNPDEMSYQEYKKWREQEIAGRQA